MKASDNMDTDREVISTPTTRFRSRSTRTLLVWLGLGASIAFAYLAVRDVRWPAFSEALRTSNYWWLVPALMVLACAIGVRALRWRLLFDPATRPAYAPTLRAMLIGYLFNQLLPVRAGEAARVVALNRDAKTSLAEATGTVVIERVFDVLALLLLLFAMVPWLPPLTWLRAAEILAIVLALGLALLGFVLLRYGERPLQLLLRPLSRLPPVSRTRVDGVAASLTRGLAGIRHVRMATIAFSWTIASWLLIGLSAWLLMRGFDFRASVGAGMLVAIATGLGWIIPAAPGAVGVFEAATVVALTAYGVSESEALSYAVVLHGMNFVPFIVAGLIALRVRPLVRGR
jgi:uncharacterized protein (TIRG00374 family)